MGAKKIEKTTVILSEMKEISFPSKNVQHHGVELFVLVVTVDAKRLWSKVASGKLIV